MSARKLGPARIIVVRGGRRYELCGLERLRLPLVRRRPAWLPGATMLVVVLLSALALERPPQLPDNPGERPPIAAVSHFTIDDFFAATR